MRQERIALLQEEIAFQNALPKKETEDFLEFPVCPVQKVRYLKWSNINLIFFVLFFQRKIIRFDTKSENFATETEVNVWNEIDSALGKNEWRKLNDCDNIKKFEWIKFVDNKNFKEGNNRSVRKFCVCFLFNWTEYLSTTKLLISRRIKTINFKCGKPNDFYSSYECINDIIIWLIKSNRCTRF